MTGFVRAKGGKGRILIVEDEADIVEVLSKRFEREGYEVLSARTGPEGLAKAKAELPSLIILDILIPEMDGFAVFRNLKRKDAGGPDTSKIPVVVLTAMGSDLRPMFEVEGVKDYLEKPFDAVQLVRKVDEILARKA